MGRSYRQASLKRPNDLKLWLIIWRFTVLYFSVWVSLSKCALVCLKASWVDCLCPFSESVSDLFLLFYCEKIFFPMTSVLYNSRELMLCHVDIVRMKIITFISWRLTDGCDDVMIFWKDFQLIRPWCSKSYSNSLQDLMAENEVFWDLEPKLFFSKLLLPCMFMHLENDL